MVKRKPKYRVGKQLGRVGGFKVTKAGESGDVCGICGYAIKWLEAHTQKRDLNGSYPVCLNCYTSGKKREIK